MVNLNSGDGLIVSHDLPVQSKITTASVEAPYLAVIISLDLSILRNLYEQVGEALDVGPDLHSLSSGPADDTLIDPIARYLALMDSPLDAEVLGPAILREIHYRLLLSPMGDMLRSLLSVDSHASRVSRAILKIRAEFNQTLKVEDLAQSVGMSQSSFHGHFKHLIGTIPLQYQKELRLIAARDLIRLGQHSVSSASFEVGYERSTHFSRDYRRKFGVLPSKDVATIPGNAENRPAVQTTSGGLL